MGYRSDVRFCTNKAGYEHFIEMMKDYLDDFGIFISVHEDDGSVVFGWNGVKWYDHYDEVVAATQTVKLLGEKGYPFEFIRVGEGYNDTERITYGDCDQLKTHIDAVTDIIIW